MQTRIHDDDDDPAGVVVFRKMESLYVVDERTTTTKQNEMWLAVSRGDMFPFMRLRLELKTNSIPDCVGSSSHIFILQ